MEGNEKFLLKQYLLLRIFYAYHSQEQVYYCEARPHKQSLAISIFQTYREGSRWQCTLSVIELGLKTLNGPPFGLNTLQFLHTTQIMDEIRLCFLL
jgi:hypothetical protein